MIKRKMFFFNSVISTAVFLSFHSVAALSVPVELTSATVFLNGAELQNKGSLTLPEGETEVLLTGVAANINGGSISLNVDPQISILATQVKTDYLSESLQTPEMDALKKELDMLNKEDESLTIKNRVVEQEIVLLQANQRRIEQSTAPLSVKDEIALLDLVKTRLTVALTEQVNIKYQREENQKKIDNLNNQIAQYGRQSNSPNNAILVKLYSPKPVTTPVTLSYLVSDAGWSPTYDIRVENINSPLKLVYKANIHQNTGLEWKNIDVSLSTSNPSEGVTIPTLTPWYIGVYQPIASVASPISMPDSMANKDMMLDEIQAPPNPIAQVRRATKKIVKVDNSGINVKFDIKLPYTVKSQNTNTVIVIKNEVIDVKYRYFAIPKLDSSAFLQAQVSDWEKLMLLPGMSNIYVDGNYVGENYLTTKGLENNTLDISLGRDRNVMVSRERDRHLTTAPSFFGKQVGQQFGYTINVKNGRKEPISLVVKDQLPVVENDTISLTDLSYPKAKYDEKKGDLVWEMELQPNENQSLLFSFKVKYPEDEQITGL